MANQRELQKEKSTQAMLDAALLEFAERGYTGTHLTDIAKRAGVAKGLVISRFGSKEELFYSVISKAVGNLAFSKKQYDSVVDVLLDLAGAIKVCVYEKTPESVVCLHVIKENDIPESCVEYVKHSFNKSKLKGLFERASKGGLIIDAEPYEVFHTFMKSAVGITESYIKAGLPLPSDENYLKLVQYKTKDEIRELNITPRKNKQHEKENNELLQTLLSDYDSIYRVNLTNDTFISFSENSYFGHESGSHLLYSDSMAKYINKNVFEDDRLVFAAAMDINAIRNQLIEKKSYSVIFRNISKGYPRYCEVKIVKVEQNDNVPTAAALGFVDRDSSIIEKFVSEKLLNDYSGVYYINLDRDSIRIVKETTASLIGDKSEYDVYSETVKKYTELVSDEYVEAWKMMGDVEYMREYLRNEDHREYSYRLKGPYGEWRRCIARVIERKNGVPVSFIHTFMVIDETSAKKFELDRTIAEQKQVLESQAILLEQALQRAEKASQAKTTFLSNMSHDIRTPMNAIMGFTNLALNNIENPDKIQDYLSKAVVSSKHLLSLINDILDMSRIESGKLQLEEIETSIPEVMKELYTIMHGQALAKQQRFNVEYDELTDSDVICDKLRLHQVLINIVNNAIKFTPVGGTVYVYVRQTSMHDQTASYEFHVKDNGVGMSAEFVERLFQPFERESDSATVKSQGSGLGMPIAKNIIDMMGGTINVKTEQGKGTEIIVYLSLKLQKKISYMDKIEQKRSYLFNGKTVLLVDDNEYNLDIVKELLEEKGFIVDVARDGRESVEKVRLMMPKKYDVILMDIQMPVMNGYEATKEIRNIKGMGINQLPIIAMTANAFSEDRQAAFEAGMNAHIIKPIVIDDLYKVLNDKLLLDMDK